VVILFSIFGICTAYVLIKLWIKFVYFMFPVKLRDEGKNPYIEYEKRKIKNDRDYKAYLEYMNKHNRSVPVAKLLTPEEKDAERKIKSLFNRGSFSR
jgi:hypothetical protein